MLPAELARPAVCVLDDPVELRRFTRFATGAAGERIADSSLRISGMHCAACAGLIEQALARVDGVLEASVSAAGERARVYWNPQRTRIAEILAAIRAAGYDATPDAALEAPARPASWSTARRFGGCSWPPSAPCR